MNTIVVDLQYGDNGKARVCDWLMDKYDVGTKYSGGPNAGGGVLIGNQEYKLHNVPASILRNKPSFIAQTCLINVPKLLEEIQYLKDAGFDVDNNLKISPLCFIIDNYHILEDVKRENTKFGVGSTKSGIMPCMKEKYYREGVRLYQSKDGKQLEKYFVNVPYELNKAVSLGKRVLLQASQGCLLDIDHGYYPYISTTNNVSGFAPGACGIGPQYTTDVIGIFKPYTTYVGVGPFPLEITDQEINDKICNQGHEFGTTTGRRRRIGWLSLPLIQYACLINGVTKLALTKGDVLSGMEIYADTRIDMDLSDPLFLQNYKPIFSKLSDSFTTKEFVYYFNNTLTSLSLPDIYFVSEGRERDNMRVV